MSSALTQPPVQTFQRTLNENVIDELVHLREVLIDGGPARHLHGLGDDVLVPQVERVKSAFSLHLSVP